MFDAQSAMLPKCLVLSPTGLSLKTCESACCTTMRSPGPTSRRAQSRKGPMPRHGIARELRRKAFSRRCSMQCDKVRLPERGVNGVGKRWKCRKMKFCLAEAKRQLVRKALREAIVIAVHQDGRKGRLAIRFNTCNNKLETYQGVLGSANLAKDFSMDAIGMRDATLAIIQNICTPKLWLPFRRPGRKVEASTFINVFDKLELFDADAAEDETVARKLLRGARQGNDNGQVFDTMFPNLKICNRDKPHGSRRNFGNV